MQSDVFDSPARLWGAPSSSAEIDNFYPAQDNHLGLSSQMTDTSALQGILNHIDVTSRARQQRPTLNPQWNQPVDRQAIPPENRVYPERIAAGE